MPLMSISPNIQELESPSRKRNHEAFSEEGPDKELPQLKLEETLGTEDSLQPSSSLTAPQSPSAQSSPLTEPGSSTPPRGSTSPDTPTRQPHPPAISPPQTTAADKTHKQAAATMPPAKQTTLTMGLAPPAKKRKKLTPAEKTAQEQEKAAKKAEAEAGKKAKEAEKEQKRKEKEEELERKAREKKEKEEELEQKKKEKEAKDQEREQKRKEKQEAAEEKERKKREKQEEEERKKRAQRKIEGFFPKKPTTPKKPQTVPQTVVVDVAVAVGARSPSPAQAQTDYQKLATPFFVKENVKLATHHLLDPEIQAAKTSILDDYLAGRRSPFQTKPFDAVRALNLSTHPPRGKRHPSVRELLSEHDGLRSGPIDLTTESQNLRIKKKQHSLKRIPVKHLKFHEDVRPAYYGTVTSVESVATLQKLAKNPIAKDLPLSYDYDSEAEWVDDDGDGDDVSLMDEDDVDEDDGEVLDDFLDDSEDVGRGPRFVTGAMEPESSGLCFEDYNRRNPNPQMYKFRMEFMIPNLEYHHSIDPFSTEYWAPEPKAVAPKAAAPKAPTVASKTQGSGVKTANVTMPPPPIPASPFSMLGAGSAVATPQTSVPQDLIKAERMDEFKAIVMEFNFLAKAALISTLKKKLGNCSLPEIKATLDYVAEKPSKKGDWQIKKGV